MFVMPVLLPYYRDHIGLGFWGMMVGEAAFSATVLLCEVPTGWLADRWKRKYVLALSGAVGMVGFGLMLPAHDLLTATISQMVVGVSISLVSGAMQALHYDSLLAAGRVEEYRKQEGKRHGLALLAVGASALTGGFLYEIHHTWPVIGTIISNIGMIVAALLMKEPERIRTTEHQNPFVAMAKTVKYALHGHREVAELIFTAAALFGTTKVLLWVQQPYYASIGLEVKWYGVLLACGFIVGSTASQLGHLLDRHFRSRTVLFGMTVALIVIFICSATLHSLAGAVLLLAGSLFWGLGWPRVQDALNACVDSGQRATVLSTCSLMIHVVFVPLSLIVAHVQTTYGVQAAVLTLAIIPSLAALVLLRVVIRDTRLAGRLIL